MPATLRLTGSGVNAVGGEEAEGVSGLLRGVAEDFAIRQLLLELVNPSLGEVVVENESQIL
jgi:hypothetical protein